MPAVSGRESLYAHDQATVGQAMQGVRAPVHRVQVVAWPWEALERDGNMLRVQQDQERMSELRLGFGVPYDVFT